MTTKMKVKSGIGTGSDVHVVEEEPDVVSRLVNQALKAHDKFVTVSVPGKKRLSVIAERVEAIWEE